MTIPYPTSSPRKPKKKRAPAKKYYVHQEGELACMDWCGAGVCLRPASVVNHYELSSRAKSTAVSWPLCDECAKAWMGRPSKYLYDTFVPLVRPKECSVVDDMIFLMCDGFAFWQDRKEAA